MTTISTRTVSLALLSLLVLMPAGGAEAQYRTRSSYRPSSFVNSDSESSSSYRYSSSIRRKIDKLDDDEVEHFRIPILFNVSPAQVSDTWGDARSNGRTHEGTDIFAPLGTPVVSPTEAVVTSIGKGSLGGNYVYTANPGGERFYYAHLDAYADDLDVGDELKIGDVIGYVGNTGNASGGATHLHFGIYKRGATNPFERLTQEFTLKERMEAVEEMLDDADDEEELADQLVRVARNYFVQAGAQGIGVPDEIAKALLRVPAPAVVAGGTATGLDLDLGSQGPRVTALQAFLIKENKGPAAKALAGAGATGYFGPMTKSALIEYQASVGISPASGYFGPVTRARLATQGVVI